MVLDCAYSRYVIRLGFVERALSVRKAARLSRHLRRCPACRDHYNRTINLERLVEHRSETSGLPSELEFSLWRPLVLSRALEGSVPGRQQRSRRLQWALGLGVAAGSVCLFLAFGIWFAHRGDTGGTFVAREESARMLAVRAICELKDINGETLLRSLSRDPTPEELSSCPVDATVRFAAMTRRSGNLYVVARFPDRRLSWLYPGGAMAPPPRVSESARLEPLAVTLAQGFARDARYVEVIFVLSADPNLGSQVERLAGANDGLRDLEALPETYVVVRRVDFDAPSSSWRR